MKKNCCDKDGACMSVFNVEKCTYCEVRSWERFAVSCKFEKRVGKNEFECTNPKARAQAGCDD